jgi:hypothetical protein
VQVDTLRNLGAFSDSSFFVKHYIAHTSYLVNDSNQKGPWKRGREQGHAGGRWTPLFLGADRASPWRRAIQSAACSALLFLIIHIPCSVFRLPIQHPVDGPEDD